MISLIAIVVTIVVMLIGAIGAFYFKKASEKISLNPLKLLQNWQFILAATLYVISSVGYILLLKRYPLSIMYPLVSITYIWVALISYFVLKEQFTKGRIAGIALIILGIIILTSI